MRLSLGSSPSTVASVWRAQSTDNWRRQQLFLVRCQQQQMLLLQQQQQQQQQLSSRMPKTLKVAAAFDPLTEIQKKFCYCRLSVHVVVVVAAAAGCCCCLSVSSFALLQLQLLLLLLLPLQVDRLQMQLTCLTFRAPQLISGHRATWPTAHCTPYFPPCHSPLLSLASRHTQFPNVFPLFI